MKSFPGSFKAIRLPCLVFCSLQTWGSWAGTARRMAGQSPSPITSMLVVLMTMSPSLGIR